MSELDLKNVDLSIDGMRLITDDKIKSKATSTVQWIYNNFQTIKTRPFITQDKENGNDVWYMTLPNLQDPIPMAPLIRMAKDNVIHRVVYYPATKYIVFQFHRVRPIGRSTNIPSKESKEIYLKNAMEVRIQRMEHVINEPNDKDMEAGYEIAATLLRKYSVGFGYKANFTSIRETDDEDKNDARILFYNLSSPINLISLDQERFAKGCVLHPAEGGIEFTTERVTLKRQDHPTDLESTKKK